MRPYGIIYVHINKVNGKVYVGQTIQTIERRCRKNDKTYNSYKTCILFYRALQRYGWEGFKTIVLIEAANQVELNQLEDKYLIEYDSCNVEKGYNTARFSEGRGKQADSTKEKISEKALAHNAELRARGIIKVAPNRKEHKIIDGVEFKHCVGNEKNSHWAPITEFGMYQRTWDHLHNKCRKCHNEYVHNHQEGSKSLLTPEELKKSYIDRSPAISAGQKRRKEQNPESLLGGKKNAKIIIRIDPNTGETKEYASGLAVKADGFDNTYVSQCCNGKKFDFQGYRWIFKKNT